MTGRGRSGHGRAWRLRLVLAVSTPVSVLALSGCASVQGAVDQAQQAVDGAQSLLDAPQQIVSACQAAVSALNSGAPAAEIRDSLSDVSTQLDEALGGAAAIPGVSAVSEAFAAAIRSLGDQQDAVATDSTRDAVATACAVFTAS